MELEKLTTPAKLGEGPCWHEAEQVLYWVDILGRKLHRFDPAGVQDDQWEFDQLIGTVAPRAQGGLIIALENGFASFDPSSGKLDAWAPVEVLAETRFNDGKCDPKGRFWCGSMDKAEERTLGTLYRMTADRVVTKVLGPVGISNGMGWSPDQTKMYYIDSPTRKVFVFDYDAESGEVTNQRPLFELTEKDGWPDGMTVDQEGKIWLAQWAGGCVTCRDPESGETLNRVSTPAPHTTACCFGGADLTELYITTARKGLTDEQLEQYPDSGCLFRLKTSTKGSPTYSFSG
ncbi:MAG: SMP-30/gluconolactonase/LRE family protein [Planctomycetaceae bacterium]|nr:SMP-30/gluconolactonase/LRE family protein [Planctomycetaceae bacterium]